MSPPVSLCPRVGPAALPAPATRTKRVAVRCPRQPDRTTGGEKDGRKAYLSGWAGGRAGCMGNTSNRRMELSVDFSWEAFPEGDLTFVYISKIIVLISKNTGMFHGFFVPLLLEMRQLAFHVEHFINNLKDKPLWRRKTFFRTIRRRWWPSTYRINLTFIQAYGIEPFTCFPGPSVSAIDKTRWMTLWYRFILRWNSLSNYNGRFMCKTWIRG